MVSVYFGRPNSLPSQVTEFSGPWKYSAPLMISELATRSVMSSMAPRDENSAKSGLSTETMSGDAAADLLKGAELSYVECVLQAPNGGQRVLRIQRRRVEVPSVQDIQMVDLENGVAYIKLTSFQKTTSRDVDAALWSLHRQGMRSLIIDVRGNPGGLLNASVEVADKFLPSGVIVSTRGRSTREDFDYQAHNVGTQHFSTQLTLHFVQQFIQLGHISPPAPNGALPYVPALCRGGS